MKSLSIKEAALQLDIGPRKLFELMRQHKWLRTDRPNMRNYPSTLAVTNGFLTPRTTRYHRGQVLVIYCTSEVTEKGLLVLADMVAANEMETHDPVVLPKRPGLPSQPADRLAEQPAGRNLHRLGTQEPQPGSNQKAG